MNSSGKKILLLTDCPEADSNLGKMVSRLSNAFTESVEVIDVNRMDIKGGCLGCVHCGFDNQCVYADTDDIFTVYNKKIREADIIILCLRIVDRYFSSRWKMFFDRKFLNTHQPQMINKQVGYIVSGPLSQLPQLREIIRFQTEIDRANLAGIVTDEHEKSEDIDSLIDDFAKRIVFYANQKYRRPYTFLVEGSGKICNDLVWGKWRFIYRGDHRFYKAHEMYGYGKSKRKTSRSILNFLLTMLCRIPGVKMYIWKNYSEPKSDPFDYLDLLEN
ncbi:NAD(P)H-dependent oxidoreductase [Ruminiclostridium josui]|uniref:NAD(P)H-dependent oxidoreductase n=1 Tax=Ruminiclostridium josui TaxID=1499 RepID=UPI0006CFBE97|nr:NAD(P)H-dependent oxidoreductase [Ruminiclostridium josui]